MHDGRLAMAWIQGNRRAGQRLDWGVRTLRGAMMYDHRSETKHWKTVAAAYRAEAALIRSEAERKASALERDAERKEQLAHHICRLVTGDATVCCDPE